MQYPGVLYKHNTKAFAENLRRWRTDMGMSQRQLAEEIGCSREAVCKWERGQSMPDWEFFFVLSQMIGGSMDDLFIRKDSEVKDFLDQYTDIRHGSIISQYDARLIRSDDPDDERLVGRTGLLEFYADRGLEHFIFILPTYTHPTLISLPITDRHFSDRYYIVKTTQYTYVFEIDDDLLTPVDRINTILTTHCLVPDEGFAIPLGDHIDNIKTKEEDNENQQGGI